MADVVALLEVVVARMLVLEEIVEEGVVLVPESEVEEIALLDVKLLEGIVDVETDPVLEPPREVALVTVVEPVNVVESPAELPSNVEVPLELEVPESVELPLKLEVPESVEDTDVVELAEVEVPEPELPVMPSRAKVPDQP